jgi:hypothetical protein
MRIVLDTNILVSAALKRQSVPAVAAHLAEERGTLLKSRVTFVPPVFIQTSTRTLKPPKIRRLPSNGIGLASG